MRTARSVLVFGGSGFIGSKVLERLRDSFKVFSTYYKKPTYTPGVTHLPCNMAKEAWVKRILYTVSPDVIIYLCGNGDPVWNDENHKQTEAVKDAGITGILKSSHIMQSKFLLVTSAYIFDGQKGNYREDDAVLPKTTLGRFELGAENVLKTKSTNHVILRLSRVFGRSNAKHPSMTDQVRMSLLQQKTSSFITTQLESFTHINPVIDAVEKLSIGSFRNETFHLGGLTRLTPYEFMQKLAKTYGYATDKIAPSDKFTPGLLSGMRYDFSLNSTKSMNQLGVKALSVEEALEL